jgi:hypothetical protein
MGYKTNPRQRYTEISPHQYGLEVQQNKALSSINPEVMEEDHPSSSSAIGTLLQYHSCKYVWMA